MRQKRGLADVIIVVAMLACAAVVMRGVALGGVADDWWLRSLLFVLPAAALASLAPVLLARQELRTNVALLLVALLISLFAIEGMLRLLPGQTPAARGRAVRAAAAAAAGTEVDRRSRAEVMRDLKAAGRRASITLPAPALWGEPYRGEHFQLVVDGRRLLPLGNVSRTTTIHCNERGTYSIFPSDEHGFNNPSGIWKQPIALAAVGDSFVQGACVDPAETLVANLRKTHPATVGMGLDGFGPLSQLALIREYLLPARPGIVLWFYYEGNDLSNLSTEQHESRLRAYLTAGNAQGLRAYQAQIDSALESFVERLVTRELSPEKAGEAGGDQENDPPARAGRLRGFLKLYRIRTQLGLTELERRRSFCCDLDLLEAVLREARATVDGWGGQLRFVYLPTAERYFDSPLVRLRIDELRARGRVLDRVRDVGIPILDIHHAFRATGDPRKMFVGNRTHYSALGYRVAAEAVARDLQTDAHVIR